jgi:hypothetical protein
VNVTLGTLCRFHYPGMVTIGGVLQLALKWEHYKLQLDDQGVTTAARVWNEFWVLFYHNLYNYYLFDSFISCLTNLFFLFRRGIVYQRGRSSAYKLGLVLCLTRHRRRWLGT